MTNYDKIKEMSIDEIANIMQSVSMCDNCVADSFCEADKPCGESFKEWLQSEAK